MRRETVANCFIIEEGIHRYERKIKNIRLEMSRIKKGKNKEFFI
jgi:hypothetical protein